jgi:hypothetical protein
MKPAGTRLLAGFCAWQEETNGVFQSSLIVVASANLEAKPVERLLHP